MSVDTQIVPRGKSIAEAMTELNLSQPTIYRLLASNKLRAVKAGSKTIITSDSIEEYWNSLPAATFRAPKVRAA